jgi:hypothetical protein
MTIPHAGRKRTHHLPPAALSCTPQKKGRQRRPFI